MTRRRLIKSDLDGIDRVWILVIGALVGLLTALSWIGSQRLADVLGQVSMLLEIETARYALMSYRAAQDDQTLGSLAHRLDELAANRMPAFGTFC